MGSYFHGRFYGRNKLARFSSRTSQTRKNGTRWDRDMHARAARNCRSLTHVSGWCRVASYRSGCACLGPRRGGRGGDTIRRCAARPGAQSRAAVPPQVRESRREHGATCMLACIAGKAGGPRRRAQGPRRRRVLRRQTARGIACSDGR